MSKETNNDANSTQSTLTLRKSFFDDLWPMILEKNICDIQSKDTSQYFVPLRRFDNIWAHELLASKNFKPYEAPINFHCSKSEEFLEGEPTRVESKYNIVIKAHVPKLNEQLYEHQQKHEERQKLACDFANRKFPWYMQRPIYDSDFELNDNVRDEFTSTFELNILRNIHTFHSKLMIIDAGAEVHMKEVMRWLKFYRYVQMIAVVRCNDMARKLLLFNGAFYTIYTEENLENTWQEELTHALNLGVKHAMDLKFFENCAKPFVFAFSRKRGMCAFDTFKMLRKF